MGNTECDLLNETVFQNLIYAGGKTRVICSFYCLHGLGFNIMTQNTVKPIVACATIRSYSVVLCRQSGSGVNLFTGKIDCSRKILSVLRLVR